MADKLILVRIESLDDSKSMAEISLKALENFLRLVNLILRRAHRHSTKGIWHLSVFNYTK